MQNYDKGGNKPLPNKDAGKRTLLSRAPSRRSQCRSEFHLQGRPFPTDALLILLPEVHGDRPRPGVRVASGRRLL